MLIEHIVNSMPIPSNSIKLIFGCALSAVLVSFGFVIITQLLSFTLNPGLAASFGAIAAASYGVKNHKNQ